MAAVTLGRKCSRSSEILIAGFTCPESVSVLTLNKPVGGRLPRGLGALIGIGGDPLEAIAALVPWESFEPTSKRWR